MYRRKLKSQHVIKNIHGEKMMKVMNVLLAVCGLSVMAADVRVRVADGVPQLQVDGVPVRARWFFGGPEAQQLVVKPGGQWIEFDTAVEEP
jgi:hypothetical protein